MTADPILDVSGQVGRTQVIFQHGVGRSGPQAWPRQAKDPEPTWVFLRRTQQTHSVRSDAQRLVEVLHGQGPSHVVAHSYGGNAAVIAAQQHPHLVLTLTLCEPACFDLARGPASIEDHIDTVARLSSEDVPSAASRRELGRVFADATGVDPASLPVPVREAQLEQFRTMSPPWGTALRPEEGLPVPTLVLTGGWSPLYEQIADALGALGARRRALVGSGHRVQDHPDATATMLDWMRRATGIRARGLAR